MRKTALTDVQMYLWSPVGVTIKKIEQVYPQIVSLATYPDPANPRHRIVSLGSFAAGDQRDYLIDLEVPAYAPGQQFLMVRPLMKYYAAGSGEEEKSERKGWVFAQWTEDAAQAAQIDDQVAHYTNQEELSESIREGQEALARGDDERATRLLGHALEISQRSVLRRWTPLRIAGPDEDQAGQHGGEDLRPEGGLRAPQRLAGPQPDRGRGHHPQGASRRPPRAWRPARPVT